MSVKMKDRKVSGNLPLEKAHRLLDYVLVITRPAEYDDTGSLVRKPGHLGTGQRFQVFGQDYVNYAKAIQENCYAAYEVHLKDAETLTQKQQFNQIAVDYCDKILRSLDYCIYHYGATSLKKRRSFIYLAHLTRDTKLTIKDRMNRDKLIYEQQYKN